MRPFANPRDGGGATRGGFMLEYGTGRLSGDSRKAMFTHEMVHHFIGSLAGDSGQNAWFGEGLAEFYKIRAPYRAGLLGIDGVLHEINVMTDAYYTNAFVATPIVEAGRLRWADRSIQTVPYNRGFMYFVDLNAKIVARSGGKRSLDDLVRAMLARRNSGLPYDEASWRTLLLAELGPEGPADLDAMQAGRLITPPDNAFGSCFRRVKVDGTRRPILGFEENTLLTEPFIVTELDENSAAARAGLRNGDKIVSRTGVTERIAHSASNIRLDPIVELTVRRGDEMLDIRFSTEGPGIDYYRWLAKRKLENCDIP